MARPAVVRNVAPPAADLSEPETPMRIVRVQLEAREPGWLMSCPPLDGNTAAMLSVEDGEEFESDGENAKPKKPRKVATPMRGAKVAVAEQARRARYLIPGTEQLCLPARSLHGALKEGAKAFKMRGQRISQMFASGVIATPGLIPLVDMDNKPLTRWQPFIRNVPIKGGKGGNTPCGRARVVPPFRTAEFDLACSMTLFHPWESDPARGDALQGLALIEAVLRHASINCGVLAWRPSSPFSPGHFGRFRVVKVEDTEQVVDADAIYAKAFAGL